MKTSIYNNMTTSFRILSASILLMISANIGGAQVTNTPVAANAQVLNLGPDRMICQGQNFFLDAGPGFTSYHWSNLVQPNLATSQSFSTNVAGCYWVRTVDMLGNIQFDTVLVSILANPVADFAFLGPTGNGSDQAVSNNSLNANAYMWEFGDGSVSYDANPIHNFPANGSYTICLHAYSDCTNDVYCQTVNVTWKKGSVKQVIGVSNEITISPSVTNGPMTLNLGDQATGVTNIQVVGTNGVTVQSVVGPYISNQVNLNLENHPAGIYYVMINYPNNRITKVAVKM